MSIHQPDFSKKYTFTDMETWEEPERFELIDGVPFLLASPSVEHEDVSTQLRTVFNRYVREKKPECRVYGDPAGILLDENEKNFVRPDLFVICRPVVKDGQMVGVPLFIAEILSKSTASYDVHVKHRLYERYGVQEYWVVDPVHQLVQVYRLNRGKFEFAGQFSREDVIPVDGLGGLAVHLEEIFLLV
ncbi:MAG: Uma2 family endonuclease [Bacilli bacterium]